MNQPVSAEQRFTVYYDDRHLQKSPRGRWIGVGWCCQRRFGLIRARSGLWKGYNPNARQRWIRWTD